MKISNRRKLFFLNSFSSSFLHGVIEIHHFLESCKSLYTLNGNRPPKTDMELYVWSKAARRLTNWSSTSSVLFCLPPRCLLVPQSSPHYAAWNVALKTSPIKIYVLCLSHFLMLTRWQQSSPQRSEICCNWWLMQP